MTKLNPPLTMQYEFTSPEFDEGSFGYVLGSNAKEQVKEMGGEVTRVLLRTFTQQEANYINMMIKQDMAGVFLQQDMNEDAFTSHQN